MKTDIVPDLERVGEEFAGEKVDDNRSIGVGFGREGAGAMGDDIAADMTAQNGAVAHGEGILKSVMVEMGPEGGVEEKGPETAAVASGGVSAEGFEKKKSRKGLVIGVVVGILALAGAIGAGVWLVGQKDDKQEGNGGGNAAVVEKPEEGEALEEDVEDELVELSLDGEVVKRVYGRFSSDYWRNFGGLGGFYKTEDDFNLVVMTDMKKYSIALLNLKPSTCDQEHRLVTYVDEDRVEHYNIYGNDFESCYAGVSIRNKVTEIFGDEDFVLNQEALRGQVIVNGEGYVYFSEGDEVVNVASGATAGSLVSRALYAAEKDATHLYLYEVVTVLGSCYFDGYCYPLSADGDDTIVDENNSVAVRADNLADYKDILDRFKWTFRKNGEGNYVFEGLERAN